MTVMRMRRVEFQDYQDKVSFNKHHCQQILHTEATNFTNNQPQIWGLSCRGLGVSASARLLSDLVRI